MLPVQPNDTIWHPSAIQQLLVAHRAATVDVSPSGILQGVSTAPAVGSWRGASQGDFNVDSDVEAAVAAQLGDGVGTLSEQSIVDNTLLRSLEYTRSKAEDRGRVHFTAHCGRD